MPPIMPCQHGGCSCTQGALKPRLASAASAAVTAHLPAAARIDGIQFPHGTRNTSTATSSPENRFKISQSPCCSCLPNCNAEVMLAHNRQASSCRPATTTLIVGAVLHIANRSCDCCRLGGQARAGPAHQAMYEVSAQRMGPQRQLLDGYSGPSGSGQALPRLYHSWPMPRMQVGRSHWRMTLSRF